MKKMKKNLGVKIATVALAFILSLSTSFANGANNENLRQKVDQKFNTTFFTKNQEELYYLINQTPPDTIPNANSTDNANNTTETQLLQQVIDQANKVPLSELMKNPIFEGNWNDAKNLKKKKVELAKKKTLTDDEKTMWSMAEYATYKEFPSARSTDFMRSYLAGELDLKYLATDTDGKETRYVITDEVVGEQYKEKMKEMEGKMANTKNLRPQFDNGVAESTDSDWD